MLVVEIIIREFILLVFQAELVILVMWRFVNILLLVSAFNFHLVVPDRIFDQEHDKSMNRLNYGAIFKYKGSIAAVTSLWFHTFLIKLPKQENLYANPDTNQNISRQILMRPCALAESIGGRMRCNNWAANVQFLEKIYTDGHEQIQRLNQAIHDIIPTGERPPSTKQALLPFLSDIFKSIAGTATVKDVEVINSNMKKLAELHDSQTKVYSQSLEHMNSFMLTSTK